MKLSKYVPLSSLVVALAACGGGASPSSAESGTATDNEGSSGTSTVANTGAGSSGSGSGGASGQNNAAIVAGPSNGIIGAPANNTGTSVEDAGVASADSVDNDAATGDTGVTNAVRRRDAGSGSATGDAEASADAGGGASSAARPDAGRVADSGGGASTGSTSGWLHTTNNLVYQSDGTPWVGRGVNIDDMLFCGYNYNLQTLGSSAEADVKTVIDEAVKGWHSNFLRISLYMDSYGTALNWANDTDGYASAMTRIVNYVGTTYPGTYVLLSLRSDASMNCPNEPACVPTANTVPVYKALVDSFANDNFVMFGLANEPAPATADLIAAMNLGVAAVRAEETKLGVPQHLVAVQTMSSTGSFTPTTIQPAGNILYEVHYYPALSNGGPEYYSAYAPTFPMLIGEYGDFEASGNTSAASFFKDMETMQISSLAWDLDPLNNCAPDLVNVNSGNAASPVTANSWGQVVQAYLANPSSYR